MKSKHSKGKIYYFLKAVKDPSLQISETALKAIAEKKLCVSLDLLKDLKSQSWKYK